MFPIALTIRKATAADAYTPWNLAAYQRLRHISRPPRALWIAVATEAAADAGLDPEDVLGGYKGHKAARCRWVAWKRILDMPEGYTLRGLARVCGWAPTTIRSGLRFMEDDAFVSAIWHGPVRKRIKP